MKKIYLLTLILFITTLFSSSAQSNAARRFGNNYQRITCGYYHTLEIRGGDALGLGT